MAGPKTRRILDAIPVPGPSVGDPGYNPMWDEVVSPLVGIPTHYDIEGQPISMREWTALWSLDFDAYRRIAWTETNIFHVSTVWLGLDHGWGRTAPLIFESMTFDNDISVSKRRDGFTTESGIYFPPFPEFYYHREQDQRRYATLEQALAGHAEMVAEAWAMEKAMGAIDPREGM